jgi:hypothetical protein
MQDDDNSAVSDSRAFKITKRRTVTNRDNSMMSTMSRDKPKSYAEAAQQKKKVPI